MLLAQFVPRARGAIVWQQTIFLRVRNVKAEGGVILEAEHMTASDAVWECSCLSLAALHLVKSVLWDLFSHQQMHLFVACVFPARTWIKLGKADV